MLMRIFAISDLHLSEAKSKPMDIFGQHWIEHWTKIRKNWINTVEQDDVVLIPGDISWAMTLDDALADLNSIGQLPGKKIIIRGNHDYWWSSISRVRQALPLDMFALQNDSIHIQGITFCGTRGWVTPSETNSVEVDSCEVAPGMMIPGRAAPVEIISDVVAPGESTSEEVASGEIIPSGAAPVEEITPDGVVLGKREKLLKAKKQHDIKIFNREIHRLRLSLDSAKEAEEIIVLLHYPPFDEKGKQNDIAQLLKEYPVSHAVFGHLHNISPKDVVEGNIEGINYHLVSCDYLNFELKLIMKV
jgi:predicted phosphohydrolase